VRIDTFKNNSSLTTNPLTKPTLEGSSTMFRSTSISLMYGNSWVKPSGSSRRMRQRATSASFGMGVILAGLGSWLSTTFWSALDSRAVDSSKTGIHSPTHVGSLSPSSELLYRGVIEGIEDIEGVYMAVREQENHSTRRIREGIYIFRTSVGL